MARAKPVRSRRRRGLAAAVGALAITCVALPAAAPAKPRDFTIGFSDSRYRSEDQAIRDAAFERTTAAGGELVRINLTWNSVAPVQPADPRNPADPAYDFAPVDRAVQGASAAGLDVLLTVYSAPAWAEGSGRPSAAPPGTWRPQSGAVADFATAVASRYSGGFGGLPRVRYFQAWNEPNLSGYLTPQSEGDRAVSPGIYRELLNSFAGAVRAVNADNQVVTAGTAPYGDAPGGQRVRPLAFWRELLCLSGRRALERTPCPQRAEFDVAAHHPINTSGGPKRSALHPDDVSTPDFGEFRRVVRAAERRKTIAGGRHALWATELWWDSNPPDATEGIAVEKHARWLEEALYVLTRDGADTVINLQLQDAPFDPDNPFAENTTGVLFADGSPKPAFTAFRFPFVTERSGKRTVVAWGRSPASGRLAIERRKGDGWRRVSNVRVRAGETFEEKLRLRGRATLRARIGDEASLTWSQR